MPPLLFADINFELQKENLMKADRRKEIDRRKFIKASGAGLAGLTLRPQLSMETFAQVAITSQRRIFPLNHKWLYSDKVLPNGPSPHFDDRRFVQVTIPPHKQDAAVAWLRR